jgi:ankyrin repeat protein
VRAEKSREGLDAAEKQRRAVSPKLIRERDDCRIAIAKLLIAAGVDLDLDDGYGATALYVAVYNEFNDLAMLLMDSGANVNTKTGVYIDGPGDETPLHRASDNPVLLEALLKHGADVNVKDTWGHSPLDWARLQDNNDQCIQLLLDAGAK